MMNTFNPILIKGQQVLIHSKATEFNRVLAPEHQTFFSLYY